MQIQNPSRFLKIASFAIAFGILGFGTLLAEKNAELFDELHPKSVGASVVDSDDKPKCEKVGRNSIVGELGVSDKMKIYATKKDDLQNILANQNFEYTETISTALEDEAIALVEVQKNREYEFTVLDGEPEFWECILTESELFENVTIVGEGFFETDELSIANEKFDVDFEKFGYHLGATSRVPKFLDIVELPDEIEVAKRTAYFYDRPFARVFEIETNKDFTYADLKKTIIAETGSLNHAAFGEYSMYATWDDLAATIFLVDENRADGKVVAFVYEYKVFRHIRRAILASAKNYFYLVPKDESEK